MKIKVLCSKQLEEAFLDAVHKQAIEVSSSGELVLIEPQLDRSFLLVKDERDYVRIALDDILFIEAYGSQIQVHTEKQTYLARENLHTLEGQLYDKGFLRIHKSYIVQKKAIERIRSSIHMKFQLVLRNGSVLKVSRSYYYYFKDEIGF